MFSKNVSFNFSYYVRRLSLGTVPARCASVYQPKKAISFTHTQPTHHRQPRTAVVNGGHYWSTTTKTQAAHIYRNCGRVASAALDECRPAVFP
ncbi:hypothetical protein L596_006028 [Steinernema carpocapsae]|uniref:Uncharacterized protein n=1 Tax=Steinernema carpocapsae TaxID=34508 RepID=A0A4U8V7Q2_STECR|nr:hypothetical protein L596_006028 [Steinernema carpocapsae]